MFVNYQRITMNFKKYIPYFFILLFFVGILIHIYCGSREIAITLTTPFLLFIAIFSIGIFLKEQNNPVRSLMVIVLIFSLTVALEILGVLTGKVFGEYQYGVALNLKLKDVPLVIGLNWVLLVFATKSTVHLLFKNHLQKVFLKNLVAGLLLVSIDFFIEPVAIILDYWQWNGGAIPLQNYIAWFLISQIAYLIIDYSKIEIRSKILSQLYLIMLCYFILLRYLLGDCT